MLSTQDAELADAFVEASSDALIVVDGDGLILFANASTETLLGHPPDSLRGREVDDLVPARFHRHRRQRGEFAADPHPRPMGRGLHNRRFLHESLEREIARAARSGQPIAVVALDLDHFKAVDDVHGHAAGDVVLRHVGELLRSHVRASDFACRTGGEEFTVVLTGSPLPIALDRAEAWRAALAAAPVAAAGSAVVCTMSVGVALLHAEGETFEQCWARADGALYRAKQQGRNRVVSAED